MKASELRIGNYIGIISAGIEKQATADHIKWIAEGDRVYKPIPLTEEWLIKFGFEKLKVIDYYRWHIKVKPREVTKRGAQVVEYQPHAFFGIVLTGGRDGFSNILFWREQQIGFGEVIECVHQLQNLYFALTGEELTIKEPTTV